MLVNANWAELSMAIWPRSINSKPQKESQRMQKTPFKNATDDGVVQGIVVSKEAVSKLVVETDTKVRSV